MSRQNKAGPSGKQEGNGKGNLSTDIFPASVKLIFQKNWQKCSLSFLKQPPLRCPRKAHSLPPKEQAKCRAFLSFFIRCFFLSRFIYFLHMKCTYIQTFILSFIPPQIFAIFRCRFCRLMRALCQLFKLFIRVWKCRVWNERLIQKYTKKESRRMKLEDAVKVGYSPAKWIWIASIHSYFYYHKYYCYNYYYYNYYHCCYL